MEQTFVDLWFKNKDKLKEALINYEDLEYCSYLDLFVLTIKNVINADCTEYNKILDEDKITEINDGDYQGTLLFVIPKNTCQPMENDYYITFVDYGSCSGCDTLIAIQNECNYEQQIEDFMILCLLMIERMKKIY